MDDRHRGAAVSRKVVGLIPDVKVDVSITLRPEHVFNDSCSPATLIRSVIYQKMVESFGIFAHNWDVTSWSITASLNTYDAFRCMLQTLLTCLSDIKQHTVVFQ